MVEAEMGEPTMSEILDQILAKAEELRAKELCEPIMIVNPNMLTTEDAEWVKANGNARVILSTVINKGVVCYAKRPLYPLSWPVSPPPTSGTAPTAPTEDRSRPDQG